MLVNDSSMMATLFCGGGLLAGHGMKFGPRLRLRKKRRANRSLCVVSVFHCVLREGRGFSLKDSSSWLFPALESFIAFGAVL